MPVSVEDVDARYCKQYFVGLEEDDLPIGGHVTVIEESSASTKMMPSFIL